VPTTPRLRQNSESIRNKNKLAQCLWRARRGPNFVAPKSATASRIIFFKKKSGTPLVARRPSTDVENFGQATEASE
jgi:hypothetical protein